MSVKELLQATVEREKALYEQLAEARSFRLQLETLDQNYEWVGLPFERITAGMIGIVKSQNWLFQVSAVHPATDWHNSAFFVDMYDELASLYNGGDGVVWNHPDDCDFILAEYPEDRYDVEGIWILRDCLFAVYRSEG